MTEETSPTRSIDRLSFRSSTGSSSKTFSIFFLFQNSVWLSFSDFAFSDSASANPAHAPTSTRLSLVQLHRGRALPTGDTDPERASEQERREKRQKKREREDAKRASERAMATLQTQMTQLMLTATQQQQLPSLFDDSDDEEELMITGVRERRRFGENCDEKKRRREEKKEETSN